MKKIISKSRRRTPWSGVADATALQSFIDECTRNNYRKRHPKPTETGEAELLNSFDVNECRRCGSSEIRKFGYTPNGIRRYRCKECGRTFTVLTDTIFDSHKIPLTEWLDFLLSIFGHGSFNLVSKNNRNAYNTTRYWMDKVFLVLRDCQVGLVLREDIQLDETYYKVRQSDIETKEEGKQYRGLSRNQICIGIACDDTNVICFVEGKGKPTKQGTLQAFGSHIEHGATISHDMEQAHDPLITLLDLKSIEYDSREIKKLNDRENPLNRVNQYCRLLKQFLNAHSGFIRDDLQDYLNLFTFIMNPPNDKQEKVEKFMNRALNCRITHRYRD
jgi:transposase-like protein/DNA-directed RNA polymerase subunit RPC12/RpoP